LFSYSLINILKLTLNDMYKIEFDVVFLLFIKDCGPFKYNLRCVSSLSYL
jgi:hypothetical protein